MADPRDDYWANTGRKPKKDFLPSTRNNLLDDLVKDTEEFSGLTSTAVEGMGDLMTSKVAGANTSSNGFDKGGSAVVAPEPTPSGLHDVSNKHAIHTHPDASMNRPVINVTSDTATAPVIETYPDTPSMYPTPDAKPSPVAPSGAGAKPQETPLGAAMKTPEYQEMWSGTMTALSDDKVRQAIEAIRYDLAEGVGTYEDYDLRSQGSYWQGPIGEIQFQENQLVHQLMNQSVVAGIGGIPDISGKLTDENTIREAVRAEIKANLMGQGFAESEVNVLMTRPGERPAIDVEYGGVAVDWDTAATGTTHTDEAGTTYQKMEDGSVEVVDTQMLAEDQPQGQTTTATGETIFYTAPFQWNESTNNLTNLMTATRATNVGVPKGANWSALQQAVTKPVELPPNYIVRTDPTTGQVFIEWDYRVEGEARTSGITPPQRLAPDEERQIIAGAEAYYTQLNRAQQLLTQHYKNEFDIEIMDKELAQRASELELQERKVKISEDEYNQLYGVGGLEGKKFEALYGKEADGTIGVERLRAQVEQDRLELEKDLRHDKLMLEAGKIIFSKEKAEELGLDVNATGVYETLASQLQTRTLAIQDAEQRGFNRVEILDAEGKPTGRFEDISTAKQRNQHIIEAQQYANAQTEQSGRQHLVMDRAKFEKLERQNRPGDPVGAYGEYVILRTQTPTFAREQFGEAVSARKNQQAIEQDRINADREIAQITENLRLTGISTQAATDLQVANVSADAAKQVAQLRLDAERTGVDNEITLLETRIELEAQREGQTLTRQEIARQAELQLQITLSKQRVLEEASLRGIALEDKIAERLATLQIQKDIGTENSANALAQVTARMAAEERMATERTEADKAIATTQMTERVALSEVERAAALDRLTKEIAAEAESRGVVIGAENARAQAERELREALQTGQIEAEQAMQTAGLEAQAAMQTAQINAQNVLQGASLEAEAANLAAKIQADADAQGLAIDAETARAQADRDLQLALANLAGTQALSGIQAQTAAEAARLQARLTTETSFAQQQRQELAIATDPMVVAQARQVASTFVSNLNAALAQGSQGNFEEAATAMAAELPPPPPGIAWDANVGSFIQRPGFEGREMTPATQEWISATTGAYKARDRAEQAIREGTRLRTESQLRESERQTADEDFRQAMLTSQIDTAEEAITRQRMAESRQIENQTKLDNLQMLFGLLANPVQLGYAKKHGLLGQIEAVLGFAISNVPEAAIGPVIPNVNEWQTMDSEQQAFSIANFVEQGGSPTDFMAMVQGAAPAQMQQIQYGVV